MSYRSSSIHIERPDCQRFANEETADAVTDIRCATPWKIMLASPPGASVALPRDCRDNHVAHDIILSAQQLPEQPRPPPGTALSLAEKNRLAGIVEPGLLETLLKIRCRPQSCCMDLTFGLIEAAGRKVPAALQILGSIASHMGSAGAAITEVLDTFVPMMEQSKSNMRPYSLPTLLSQGVPPDCLAVLVCERQRSDGSGGRAIAVLEVDLEAGQLSFLENRTLKKSPIAAFSVDVIPRTIAGVSAIPGRTSARMAG